MPSYGSSLDERIVGSLAGFFLAGPFIIAGALLALAAIIVTLPISVPIIVWAYIRHRRAAQLAATEAVPSVEPVEPPLPPGVRRVRETWR